MSWTLLLFSALYVYRFMQYSPKNNGAYVDTQNVPIDILDFTNKFMVSRGCEKTFGGTRIKARAKKRVKLGRALPKLARPVSMYRPVRVPSTEKTGQASFPIYS